MQIRCTSRTSSRPTDRRCIRSRFWMPTTSAITWSPRTVRPWPRRPIHASGDPLITNIEHTQLMPRLGWENPRVRLLSDSWLLTIVAILSATGVPWFASGFEMDLGTASWGLLALGGILIALTILESRTSPPHRSPAPALPLLDVIIVIVLGFTFQPP